jgi:hypothetical protein
MESMNIPARTYPDWQIKESILIAPFFLTLIENTKADVSQRNIPAI